MSTKVGKRSRDEMIFPGHSGPYHPRPVGDKRDADTTLPSATLVACMVVEEGKQWNRNKSSKLWYKYHVYMMMNDIALPQEW